MAPGIVPTEHCSADQQQPVTTTSAPPTKTVAAVIELARRFVEERFSATPGFRGAHLVGSINHLPGTALFPTYQDVDIAIVLDSVDYQEIEEVLVDGYVLECILSGSSRYQSAEAILAVPGMACNLQPNSVLVDPDGLLTHIHQVVAAEFAQRKWVSLRTEDELHGAEISLTAMAEAENPVDLIKAWGDFIMHCSAAITVCHLKPPTHRRTLVNLKALMQSQEEQELYHQILEAFGSTQLSEAEVRLFLDQCLAAFDRAIEVKKQPVPFDWKLDPCIRDYLQKGTLEIIDEGAHRESLFWIALFFLISTLAIHQDGSPEEKPAYTARLINFLRALGLESPEAIKRRVQLCMPLHQRVAEYVRKSVATSPRFTD